MMAFPVILAAIWFFPVGAAGGQAEPPAPRSTTERPNLSAPGLEQTLSGVLMDAACAAMTDERSELTKTPRILPPRNDVRSPLRRDEQTTRRSQPSTTPERDIPERYRDCKVKSSTTSFAIYANNRMYMLDRVSNQMMQEQMLKEKTQLPSAGSSAWINRTVVGTATSDDVLTLRSVRK
jgi:hypothetical protein